MHASERCVYLVGINRSQACFSYRHKSLTGMHLISVILVGMICRRHASHRHASHRHASHRHAFLAGTYPNCVPRPISCPIVSPDTPRQRFLRDAKKTCKANRNVEIMDARSLEFDEPRPESLERIKERWRHRSVDAEG